jgi:hypothetical protein
VACLQFWPRADGIISYVSITLLGCRVRANHYRCLLSLSLCPQSLSRPHIIATTPPCPIHKAQASAVTLHLHCTPPASDQFPLVAACNHGRVGVGGRRRRLPAGGGTPAGLRPLALPRRRRCVSFRFVPWEVVEEAAAVGAEHGNFD